MESCRKSNKKQQKGTVWNKKYYQTKTQMEGRLLASEGSTVNSPKHSKYITKPEADANEALEFQEYFKDMIDDLKQPGRASDEEKEDGEHTDSEASADDMNEHAHHKMLNHVLVNQEIFQEVAQTKNTDQHSLNLLKKKKKQILQNNKNNKDL